MDELLIKYLLDEATTEERRRVEEWLGESPANARRFAQFKRLRELGRQTAAPIHADSREALERLRRRYKAAAPAITPAQPRPVHLRAPGKVAAVIAGLLVVGLGTWVVLHQKKATPVVKAAPPMSSAETTLVMETKPGKDSQAPRAARAIPGRGKTALLTADTLPDGSIVLLQPQARIDWQPTGKTLTRRVRLRGKASFFVAADASKPFVVETDILRVTVLGTSFTIDNGRDSTTVVVHTGLVQAANDTDSLILRSGERLAATRSRQMLTATLERTALDNKQVMRLLIDQLIREKWIPDKESLGWLALDPLQFIIDDRQMPDSTGVRYRSKYLLPDGMGYYYGKVKVHGHGYFFEKKELY